MRYFWKKRFSAIQSRDWVIMFATMLVNRMGANGFLRQIEYKMTTIPSIMIVMRRVAIKSFWSVEAGK